MLDIIEILESRKTAWKVAQLASLLSLGSATIYGAVIRGSLPAFKLGGAVRISPKDALEWVKARYTGITNKKRAA